MHISLFLNTQPPFHHYSFQSPQSYILSTILLHRDLISRPLVCQTSVLPLRYGCLHIHLLKIWRSGCFSMGSDKPLELQWKEACNRGLDFSNVAKGSLYRLNSISIKQFQNCAVSFLFYVKNCTSVTPLPLGTPK